MIIIKTERVGSFRVVRGRRKSGSVIECGYCEKDAVKEEWESTENVSLRRTK